MAKIFLVVVGGALWVLRRKSGSSGSQEQLFYLEKYIVSNS